MLFEKNAHRTVEIEDYNVLIDVQNVFDLPVKSNMRTYDNIWKIAIGQGYDYTTGCSLDYPYFKEHYKMLVIYFGKQHVLDTNPKTIQETSFTGSILRAESETISFITKKVKETTVYFLQRTVRVL